MSRQPDRLEARARELAIAAGIDPESRVSKPGSDRGMPAWCSFRDAARAEQNAREQAEAAAQIVNLRPQEQPYQNSPLTVIGEHEQSTIDQMRNCMSVGNAVAGVICADGHLGYAQPVGGVIAYEKQISISGVGFDIGCFTGDTRIFTLDGQTPTLAEVEGQEVCVLGCDQHGKPVPARGTCHKTRVSAALVRVTLDSGKTIRCTPDHQFMLRDGSYQRADQIAPGQSLMPLYMTADRATVPNACPLCGFVARGPSGLSRHARFKHPEAAAIARRGKDWRPGYPTLVERLAEAANNHKVVSVEAISDVEDVYCLTVPGLNNFGLASGVFVHNCGNMAVRLDTPFSAIEGTVPLILADVRNAISFGIGRTNAERAEHALFDDTDAWRESDMEQYRQKAVHQLGTVGSGNHYVDLMVDEAGFVWIGVHFGSRGFGHTSATRYLKAAGGKDGMNVPPAVVDEDSEVGRRYIAAMQLAGRYSYAGREWVVERVRQIVGGNITDMVHNHHNYAWRETHDGRDLWVVRKGATPAFPGQRGFVGGSMGDDAVILEGVDGPQARASLYSTVHGAGRLFGRKEAKRRFTRAQMDEWLRERGVLLAGGDLDESPMAYRRLPDVLAHHAESVKVLHRLRPFAVAMAGEAEFDPWKD